MNPSISNRLPPDVQTVLDDLDQLIGPVFLVGGVLRDCLLGRDLSNDLDLLVALPLEQCRKRLTEAGRKSVVMGKQHTTLLVPLKRDGGLRTIEISAVQRRPGVATTVENDLLHRDITINAMAYRWPGGPLLDPYDGQGHLPEGRIQLVNGAVTLAEDPIRALRFFRFILQLNGAPVPDDLARCEDTLVKGVAMERLRGEMDRIFSLPLRLAHHRRYLKRLFASPMGRSLLPELAALVDGEAWERSLDTLLSLSVPASDEVVSLIDLRWAALLHRVGRPEGCALPGTEADPLDQEEAANRVRLVLERLKFSRRRERRILSLTRHLDVTLSPSDKALKRLIESRVPLEGLFRLIKARLDARTRTGREHQETAAEFRRIMSRCDNLRNAMRRLSHDLALKGGDIIEIVRKRPGPWLGELQRILVEWITEDPARNRKELLEHQVREWIYKQPDI